MHFGSTELRDDCLLYPDYGALLAWNLTRDEEGGHLVILTGQTVEEEQQVLRNASWMVSCGALYAAVRVGMKGWKSWADERVRERGDEFLVWLVPNNPDIDGMVRR